MSQEIAGRRELSSPETALVTYDAARYALQECVRVDDAKAILDKTAALCAYARQVKDADMESWCAEVKLRARRKIGEISQQLEKAQTLSTGDVRLPASGKSKKTALDTAGITTSTANRCEQIADIAEAEFEAVILAAKENHKPVTYSDIERVVKKNHRKTKQQKDRNEAIEQVTKASREALSTVCEIRHCSMRELLTSGITPDCIITDPPYPREFLPLYEELAELSKEIPLVAVMCGQSYLPTIFESMCKHLDYRWTLAYLTPGGQSAQLFPRKVNTFWKPVLLFGKASEWIGDVTKSNTNDNDKRFHGWGQSESGMGDLVDRLSKPGQLVCDPFSGGGTTAVVSLKLGRRFIGCDTDMKSVKSSIGRCEAVYAIT